MHHLSEALVHRKDRRKCNAVIQGAVECRSTCDIHTHMKVIANGRRHMVLPVTCHMSAAVSGAHKCLNISSLTSGSKIVLKGFG